MEQLPSQKKQILFFLVAFFIILIIIIWLVLFKYELNFPTTKNNSNNYLVNQLQDLQGAFSNVTNDFFEKFQQPNQGNNNAPVLTNEEIEQLKEKIKQQSVNANLNQATSIINQNRNQ